MKWNKKDKSEKVTNAQDSFNAKVFRNGSFSVGIIALGVVIVIVLNLLVGALPTTVTKIDFTTQKLLTLSETTLETINNLKNDVTINYIVTTGSEDNTVQELLNRYASLNSHIKIQKVDPELYPQFVSQYTDESVSSGGLLVVGPMRTRVINYQPGLYQPIYDQNYYYTGQASSYNFNGENTITTALDYVSRADIPVVGLLEGHGETMISTTWQDYLMSISMEIGTLNLRTLDEVPSTVDVICINCPTKDLAAPEMEIITEFLHKGGKLILFSAFDTMEKLPNLSALMAEYGMKSVPGVLCESDADYYYSYPIYIFPTMNSSEVMDPIRASGRAVLMQSAHGILEADNYRSSVEVIPILETSLFAYSKVNMDATTLAKEDGDPSGLFYMGVLAKEVVPSAETRVAWFSSAAMMDETADSMVSGANSDTLLNTFNWLVDNESGITIHSKVIENEYLAITATQSTTWTIILTVVIPVVILAIGLVAWLRRRKK